MTYLQEWELLSARIRSITKAGNLYGQLVIDKSSDAYSVWKNLKFHCETILSNIECYRSKYHEDLPHQILECIDRFFEENDGRNVSVIRSDRNPASALFGLVALSAFESELTFLFADEQEKIHARSERAFMHLQRSIVVDNNLRQDWLTAFSKGETECEKLGAIHLLWHGIYAFKVSSAKAATDLVFNEPVDDTISNKGIDGLVLTEWKVADKKNAEKRFIEARTQAMLYETSLLADLELRRYRYIIVVSKEELPLALVPSDFEENDVIYRHINIPLDSRHISKRARSN